MRSGIKILLLLGLWLIGVRVGLSAEYTCVGSFSLIINEPVSITYDSTNKTFYIAQRGKKSVLEVSKSGLPLGTIFTDARDISDIAYNPLGGEGGFFIVQERPEEILETDRHGCLVRSLKLPQEFKTKKIEAVTVDPHGRRLYVVLSGEKDRILELGMDGTLTGSFSLENARDIRSLYYDPTRRHLLLLCNESNKMYETSPQGEVLDTITLDTPQAEGVARDEVGILYIMCERTKTVYVYLPEK